MRRTIPAWAIVCGAIRRPLEFKLSMLELFRLRDSALLDGIVVSTWAGEIDRHEGLRALLTARGVDLCELPPVPVAGDWNIHAQQAALREGLALCPGDSLILKYRSDKAFEMTWSYERHLAEGLPRAASFAGFPQALDFKIACQRLSTTVPFFLTDFTFLAHANDIRRMVNFDSGFDWFCRTLPMLPETRWFAPPFLRSSSLLDQYFRRVHITDASQAMMAHAESGRSDPLPGALADVIATTIAALAGHVETTTEESRGARGDLSALFGRNSQQVAGVETRPGFLWTLFNASRHMRDFAEGRIQFDGPFAAISARLDRGVGPVLHRRISNSEVKEIDAYIQEFVPGAPELYVWTPTISPGGLADGGDAEEAFSMWSDLGIDRADYDRTIPDIRRVAAHMGIAASLRIVGLERYRTHDQPLGLALLEASARLADLEGNLRLAEILLIDEHLMRRQEAKGFAEQGLAIARRSAPWYEGEALALLARTEEA